MNKKFKLVFTVILFFSIYHLIRDTFQVFEFHNSFTDVFHREHLWCGSYCNYVTYPLELFGILGSYIVLKKNKVGVVGTIVLLSLSLWLLATILP